jgi:hypothetical protein
MVKKWKLKGNSSLSHCKAGDEDPPSVRACGGASSVGGDVVPATREEYIRNSDTVATTVHLFIEGLSNPLPPLGGFRLEMPVHH